MKNIINNGYFKQYFHLEYFSASDLRIVNLYIVCCLSLVVVLLAFSINIK